jgi:hypothetical protein
LTAARPSPAFLRHLHHFHSETVPFRTAPNAQAGLISYRRAPVMPYP